MLGIIQFRTDSSQEHEQACFHKHLSDYDMDFMSVFSKEYTDSKPEEILAKYDKIILAGSGEFLLSRWGQKTAELFIRIDPLLDVIIKNDHPTMGVCFGNQLLGKHLGSLVEHDEDMAEAGIQQVKFTDQGREDPVFAGISNPLNVSMGHEDSLIQLPIGSKHLAFSDKCKSQAFKLGDNVYGMQFHVELDDNDLAERLSMYSQYDEYQLGYEFEGEMNGPRVLRNFAGL